MPAAPREKINARAICRRWGCSKAELDAVLAQPWVPRPSVDDTYDVAKVIRAAGKAGVVLPGPNAPVVRPIRATRAAKPAATAPVHDPVAEALAVLRSSEKPAEIAQAGASLAARLLAQAYEDGTAGQREIAALARALEELRRSSQAELEQAKASGQLVPQEDVVRLGGELASVFVRACDRLESALPDQVVAWSSDHAWRSSGADAQRSGVAEWVLGCLIEVRNATADRLSGPVV